MDRRKFLSSLSVASVAANTGATTLTEKADALENAMDDALNKRRSKPNACYIDGRPDYDADDERQQLSKLSLFPTSPHPEVQTLRSVPAN